MNRLGFWPIAPHENFNSSDNLCQVQSDPVQAMTIFILLAADVRLTLSQPKNKGRRSVLYFQAGERITVPGAARVCRPSGPR